MKTQFTKMVSLLLCLAVLLSFAACGTVQTAMPKAAVQPGTAPQITDLTNDGEQIYQDENGNVFIQLDADSAGTSAPIDTAAKAEYNKGVVLVKCEEDFSASALGELVYTSAEPLYKNAKWYSVKLADETKTEEAVSYLTGLGTFEKVDYDYVMGVTAEVESVDISGNPAHGKQNDTFKTHHIKEGWDYLKKNGYDPGGSPDVIVAVIDTGVDYNHIDLRNNIWINTAEIPDNGKDDDGNGYIDDVYGWNCVGDNNDPMDDNGHGTHVAGIIVAENNKEGGVGIAYNCKVMVLKAGNSSGYFNNSNIAEAIRYAYMNGASVINMSFGGSSISIAVEEALEIAYNTSVLVAGAGNDGACNNLDCRTCEVVKVCYPAALPYVIGVMSVDKDGKRASSFSNYDHNPYDSVEYEVYAVGEGVESTWPSNKYACLNGTSMAAPTVAGIAALLRSYYSDREMYSTKFIQSQIVNTGSVHPFNMFTEKTDVAHAVADGYEALTKLPKPTVNLYDYRIDDGISISEKNNGNGVIDAGETVRLYISLHNRGGVASNVNLSIDTMRHNDPTLTDPYFNFVNPTMQLSDIGTYSVRESGDKYFEIIVSADCPNDYLTEFNIRFTYTNGLDLKDQKNYSGYCGIQFTINNGVYLPIIIDEDTTLKSNRLYIVSSDMCILKGVTVVVEAGTHITFSSDDSEITVAGDLVFNGSADEMIVVDYGKISGNVTYLYTQFNEPRYIGGKLMDRCFCHGFLSTGSTGNLKAIFSDTIINSKFVDCYPYGDEIENCQIIMDSFPFRLVATEGIPQYKNCVYLSNKSSSSFYVGARSVAVTLQDVISIVKTDDRSYINLAYSPKWYSSPSGYAERYYNLEVDMLASFFGGKKVYLSDAEKEALGIDPKKGTAIFEVPGTTIEKEDIWVAYNEYNNATSKHPDFENVAILGQNIKIGSMGNNYNTTYLDTKYRWNLGGLYVGTNDQETIENMIADFSKYGKYCNILPEEYMLTPTEDMWPIVTSAYILDHEGERLEVIGSQTVKVVIEFNRDMNTSVPLNVAFGTVAPFADYLIIGDWVTARQWVGEYTLKASIENGKQFLTVWNAQAADDSFFTAEDRTGRFSFTIDTAEAMSMNLQAVAKEEGIELSFAQDDYDTLLGYNIYRSTEKDGNFVKLNPTILLASENTFLDENAEPGKTYWYTYTVVLSDFTESNPAGKVQATAKDTMAPSLYHTPVNQGYENNNLVISCTASDNVAIETVTLYYRTVGQTEWKTLTMSKQNDKYSATIFGRDVCLAGIEYYIVASDGRNEVLKGSAEAPYTVIVKSADSLLGMGDVDGNGQVTTKDALMLMQCLNGDLILTDDAFKRADLNGDNVLSAAEALRILQYVNGKVTNLDM